MGEKGGRGVEGRMREGKVGVWGKREDMCEERVGVRGRKGGLRAREGEGGRERER